MADHTFVVYVIDDDVSICRGLKRLITSYGYDVRTFSSAVEFLGTSLRFGNSCIVSDIIMPGVDGLQLQHELRLRGCNVPIIFITALADPQIRERAKLAGAAGFFQKPMDGVALVDAIKWICAGAQGNSANVNQ